MESRFWPTSKHWKRKPSRPMVATPIGAVPLRACEQGRHASLDEIDVLDGAVVLLQYGAVFQGDALQMRPQAFE